MIRKIINEDLSKLYQLDQNNLKSNWSELTYKTMILDEFGVTYLIEANYDIQGFIICQITGETADLMQLIVDKAYRNQKVATRLLNKAIKNLKDNDVKLFLLEVEETNSNAINLYEKFNFKVINKRQNYYGNNRHALVMQCEVN